MRRKVVALFVFVMVLFGGSMALVAWVTRVPEPGANAASPEVSAPAVPQDPVVTMALVVEPPVPPPVAPNPGPPMKHSAADFSHAAKAEREVVANMIRRPPHRLGRGAAAPVDLFRGLEALQADIRRCAGSQGRVGASSPTVLTLEIESLDGKVTILNAAVQSRGVASDRTIDCAQRELLGREIPVAMAQPGAHFELPFTLRM